MERLTISLYTKKLGNTIDMLDCEDVAIHFQSCMRNYRKDVAKKAEAEGVTISVESVRLF